MLGLVEGMFGSADWGNALRPDPGFSKPLAPKDDVGLRCSESDARKTQTAKRTNKKAPVPTHNQMDRRAPMETRLNYSLRVLDSILMRRPITSAMVQKNKR